MKKRLIIIATSLVLATRVQADPLLKKVDPSSQAPAETLCPSKVMVKKALNESIANTKNQLARKLNLSPALTRDRHRFGFEGKEISRVQRNGNQCDYYVPDSSAPIYTIKM